MKGRGTSAWQVWGQRWVTKAPSGRALAHRRGASAVPGSRQEELWGRHPCLTRGGNGDRMERGWLPSAQLRLGFPLDPRTRLNNPKLREGEGGASHSELPPAPESALGPTGPAQPRGSGTSCPSSQPQSTGVRGDMGSRKPGPLPQGAADAEVQFGSQSSQSSTVLLCSFCCLACFPRSCSPESTSSVNCVCLGCCLTATPQTTCQPATTTPSPKSLQHLFPDPLFIHRDLAIPLFAFYLHPHPHGAQHPALYTIGV